MIEMKSAGLPTMESGLTVNTVKKPSYLAGLARTLSRFLFVIAGFALTGTMLLTVADVILRAFKRPILGTYELVGLLGAVVIAFALPQTSRLKGHVMMDFLTGKLPETIQFVLHAITRLLALALFAILGWNLWLMANDFHRVGEVTPTLQLPLYPIAYLVALCCFVECLVLFVDMLEKRDMEP
ncbi:TRAP-type C4-dicarboxylate transport system, small permease component [Desulfomonile tiedjei DSM 6799]|uniref:TRAP-type C4-dicarboxylate transport system, small permease component n=2 Tax=Desulfomonile tiedjei TaxID=2358 RepID=I4C0G8_DESTA|nr:TRAP-type C4-dicarboxylate transport system, small permease component [Desulfomonile tiedjei DSM 6799]